MPIPQHTAPIISTPGKRPEGVNVVGFISLQAGLSAACRMNMAAMKSFTQISEYDFPRCLNGTIDAPYAYNYHHYLPEHGPGWEQLKERAFFDRRKNVAYWAWEVEDYVPPLMVEASSRFDEVWTPSKWSADALANHLDTVVKVVPHYVDCGPYRELDRENRKQGMTFLAAFDGKSRLDRKNPLGMIRAFKNAFPNKEPVKLILKCHGLGPKPQQLVEREALTDPRITMVNRYMTSAELEALYDQVDALISLHRSEGFGLHLAEAMGKCLPVIATGYSGNLEFMNSTNSLLVGHTLRDVRDEHYKHGRWADPKAEEAVEAIRYAWEEFGSSELRERVKQGYATVASRFTFFNTANTIRNLMLGS